MSRRAAVISLAVAAVVVVVGLACLSRWNRPAPVPVLEEPALPQPSSLPLASAPAPPIGAVAGQEWSDNGLAMKFCWCPPGDFKMGDGAGAVDVKLTRGFWLGKYEVTQADYGQVTKQAPSHFARTGQGKALVEGQDTGHFPVEQVSWRDATEFCHKLTVQEQEAGRLPADWEYRLPTEAQWEYACRAGTQTAFSFGNRESQLPDFAWWNANSEKRTHEVGKKPANPWGLHDMHGNVWEWCRDWHQDKLPEGPDPEVTEPANLRVFRGGSWSNTAEDCSSANRGGDPPNDRDYDLGFRITLVPAR